MSKIDKAAIIRDFTKMINNVNIIDYNVSANSEADSKTTGTVFIKIAWSDQNRKELRRCHLECHQ
jgi:hypothetical protein